MERQMALYEVTLVAHCVIAVEAESEQDAIDLACDEASTLDYQFIESGPARLVSDDRKDSVLRHADLILVGAA
jgi:hypothetical protein